MRNLIVIICSAMMFTNCISTTEEEIKVIETFQKEVDDIEISDEDFDLCEKWELNNKSIIELLSIMDLSTSEEWNSLCYTYPCYYKGKVKYKGDEYEVKMNAASHAVLYNKNSTIYFIKKESLNGFLIPCNCCE